MPQIAQLSETIASQAFWLLLIFGFVYVVIGRGMVPKVMDTVGLRDKQIADDLAAAQAARNAADEQEDAWRTRENQNRAEAQSVVTTAKARAQASSEAKLAEIQTRIDAQMAEAEAGIETARAAAASEIETVAVEAAQDIVSRLAGISVTQASAQGAVKKAMAHG